LKTTSWLLLALTGLVVAILLYDGLSWTGRQYYESLAMGADRLAANMIAAPENLANCDMVTYIRELSRVAVPAPVKVGACDVFMFNGSLAVVGVLCFLLVYLLTVLATRLVVALAPRAFRPLLMVVCSMAFLVAVLPLRPALWIVDLVVGIYLLVCLPLPGRARALLLGAAVCAFYWTVGRSLVNACGGEYFSLARLNLGVPTPSPLATFLHLGEPGAARLADQGFPYLFLVMAWLLKTLRRAAWLCQELWTGRLDEPPSGHLLVYLIGLHTLIGNAATPSFQEFVRSADRPAPDGARGLAFCFGFCAPAYGALVMLGFSPAVRLLFPHCDLASAPPWLIWSKLAAMFVIEYLFLLSTVQASIAVARLFGYGLRDNYDAPLTARSFADFWRRWNIYWREFLVVVFYYPVALGLARRRGATAPLDPMVAALVTFAGTFALNVLPLLLLSTGPLVGPTGSPGGGGLALVPSLAIYYLLDGVLVGLALMGERKGLARSRWRAALGVALTFLGVAALRCFLDSSIGLAEQVRTLARAFGAGW
jgi:hypothetical protein